MSLLLQEAQQRPQVTAGNWQANQAFYGLRQLLPPTTQRLYTTVVAVPLEWLWTYPDLIYDRIGIVASGEI